MPVQKSVGDRWQKATGCLMVVGYGLSETAPAASIDPVDGKTFSDTIGPSAEKSDFQEAGAAGTDSQGRPHHGHQDPDQSHWPTPAIQLESAVSVGADHA